MTLHIHSLQTRVQPFKAAKISIRGQQRPATGLQWLSTMSSWSTAETGATRRTTCASVRRRKQSNAKPHNMPMFGQCSFQACVLPHTRTKHPHKGHQPGSQTPFSISSSRASPHSQSSSNTAKSNTRTIFRQRATTQFITPGQSLASPLRKSLDAA